MTDQTHASWTRDNQQYLMAAIAGVRAQINAYAAALRDEAPPALGEPFLYVFDEMNAPPALDELCRIFQLSSFERAILLVCAGMELDAKFAHCCALAQMEQRSHPTFELLLAALNDAHWDATSPAAALRKWRPVSYTHLDVYKRQLSMRLRITRRPSLYRRINLIWRCRWSG